MIPYTQTNTNRNKNWLGDGEIPGNCLQTAIASWLELPVDSVPHFAADSRPGAGWWEMMRTWSRDTLNLDFCWAPIDHDAIPVIRKETEQKNLWGGLLLAVGPTVRNSRHVVLVRASDLELVHDPHPDRTGLVEIEDLMWLGGFYEPEPKTQYLKSLEGYWEE